MSQILTPTTPPEVSAQVSQAQHEIPSNAEIERGFSPDVPYFGVLEGMQPTIEPIRALTLAPTRVPMLCEDFVVDLSGTTLQVSGQVGALIQLGPESLSGYPIGLSIGPQLLSVVNVTSSQEEECPPDAETVKDPGPKLTPPKGADGKELEENPKGSGRYVEGATVILQKKVLKKLGCPGHKDCEKNFCWFATVFKAKCDSGTGLFSEFQVEYSRGTTSKKCCEHDRGGGYGYVRIFRPPKGSLIEIKKGSAEEPLRKDPGYEDWVDHSKELENPGGFKSKKAIAGMEFQASAKISCRCVLAGGTTASEIWTVSGSLDECKMSLR
jgi:hypothetical protein